MKFEISKLKLIQTHKYLYAGTVTHPDKLCTVNISIFKMPLTLKNPRKVLIHNIVIIEKQKNYNRLKK